MFCLDIEQGKGQILHWALRATEHSVTELCISKVNQVGNSSRNVFCLPFHSDLLPLCKDLNYQISVTQIVSAVGVA